MHHVTTFDGRQVDSSSEDWRHDCEARACLALPLLQRNGRLDEVRKRRGAVEANRLRSTIYKMWISRQVDALLAMPRDDSRMALLLRIENAVNQRTRQDVEDSLNKRIMEAEG